MAGTPQYPDDWAAKFSALQQQIAALGAAAQSRVPFTGGTLTGDLEVNGALTTGGRPVYPPLIARKTSNEVINDNDLLQADEELILDVVAGAYAMDACIIYSTGTDADMFIRWSAPAGLYLDWVSGGVDYTATTPTSGTSVAALGLGDAATLGGVTSSTTKMAATPKGTLTTGAGLLALNWSQAVAQPSDTTVYAGSWIRLQRIP